MPRFCTRCHAYFDNGNFKQCDDCREKNKAASKIKYDRDRRVAAVMRQRRQKPEWTQEKWEAFVKSGGLEGL